MNANTGGIMGNWFAHAGQINNLAPYCSLHCCRHNGCRNQAAGDAPYCIAHRCRVAGCQDTATGGDGVCDRHYRDRDRDRDRDRADRRYDRYNDNYRYDRDDRDGRQYDRDRDADWAHVENHYHYGDGRRIGRNRGRGIQQGPPIFVEEIGGGRRRRQGGPIYYTETRYNDWDDLDD